MSRWKYVTSEQRVLDGLLPRTKKLALRFTAFTWGVDSCIVGTTSLDHLQQNIESINKGKLPQSMIDELRTAFHRHDNNWIGQV